MQINRCKTLRANLQRGKKKGFFFLNIRPCFKKNHYIQSNYQAKLRNTLPLNRVNLASGEKTKIDLNFYNTKPWGDTRCNFPPRKQISVDIFHRT